MKNIAVYLNNDGIREYFMFLSIDEVFDMLYIFGYDIDDNLNQTSIPYSKQIYKSRFKGILQLEDDETLQDPEVKLLLEVI